MGRFENSYPHHGLSPISFKNPSLFFPGTVYLILLWQDCIETATFANQTRDEMSRLLHMVVVGGGPTGIEFAAELQDFFKEDLEKWFPGKPSHRPFPSPCGP